MRIAVISDIHGNLAALDAVLADIANRGVDLIVNLGDALSGPLLPAECAERLIPLQLPTIRGNHERQLLTLDPQEMGLSDHYTISCLRPNQIDWIAGLPELSWPHPDVLMVHGTPRSDIEYWLETVTQEGVHPASNEEIVFRMGPARAGLISVWAYPPPALRSSRGWRDDRKSRQCWFACIPGRGAVSA
jgi:Icc-related predicted phosphoesterase